MSSMAKYAQIIWAEPTNDDVMARNHAVEALKNDLSHLTTRQAIEAAASIAASFGGADLGLLLAPKAEKAISEQSAAFILNGNEQQAVICLAVAALVLVRESSDGGGWTAADALAVSLWSALTFQDQIEHAKLEELRQDVIEACRTRVRDVATAARRRQEVPDVGTLTISESDSAGTRANNAYRKATAPVIKALKENQDLDREELDFLWWVLSEYSDLLGCPLADRNSYCRAIAAGLEGASLLRRLPGEGFRHAVLRTVEASADVSLTALLETLGDERAELGKAHEGDWVVAIPAVFPLIASLASAGAIVTCGIELDARKWGARALLEASIITMEGRPAGAA